MKFLVFGAVVAIVSLAAGPSFADHGSHLTHHKGYGVNGATSALAGSGKRHGSTRTGGPAGGRSAAGGG